MSSDPIHSLFGLQQSESEPAGLLFGVVPPLDVADVVFNQAVQILDRIGRLEAPARLVDATAEYLGIGLTSVVNAVNPERVVLGGGVIEGHPPYVDQARRIVQKRALGAATDELDIVASELGGRAGTIGAATMGQDRHEDRQTTQKTA